MYLYNVLCTYIINQQMHIYKHVQSHIIILHQHVSVTHVIIISVPYNKKTSKYNIQRTIVQKCMIKPFGVTLDFLLRSLWTHNSKYIIVKTENRVCSCFFIVSVKLIHILLDKRSCTHYKGSCAT
jgi:BarA-like signal transduction histidine kinase